jgi:AcrR family transcriptional regulator
MTTPLATPARRTRADGERTRAQILSTAAALATVEGLDRLSIGGLAEHIGMSKSGLYAHFRSKEALQLAVIEAAWLTFDREVVHPALEAAPGRATVLALIDRFLDHLERRVFPGGCFFAATIVEMHLRPGAVASRLADFDRYWLGLIREHVVLGQAAGEIDPAIDPDQLVFEIDSHVLHAHVRFPTHGDRTVLARAGRAVRHLVGEPKVP